MASCFSKLFGGGGSKEPKAVERSEPETHEGLLVYAAPEPDGDKWRLAGLIVKPGEGDAGDLERIFIRADTFASRDEAVEWSLKKGRQVIDERGQRLFADGEPTGRA